MPGTRLSEDVPEKHGHRLPNAGESDGLTAFSEAVAQLVFITDNRRYNGDDDEPCDSHIFYH